MTTTTRYEVTGDTYSVRAAIKSDGWRWDGARRVWHRATLDGTRKGGQFRGCLLSRATLSGSAVVVIWTSKTYAAPVTTGRDEREDGVSEVDGCDGGLR